jgi:hypothetical protein
MVHGYGYAGYGGGYGAGMYPYFTGLQNQLLSNQVASSTEGVLNSVCTDSRLNATEHAAIISRVSNAEGALTGEIHNSGRANGDLIHSSAMENLKATYDATNVVGAAVRDNSLNNKEAIERNGIASRDAVERNGMATRDQVHKTSSNLKDIVVDFGNRNGMAIENTHGMNIATQERIAGELRNFLDRNHETTILGIKETELEICKAKNDLERQASDNTGMLRYKDLKNKCELQKQASDNFAAIQTKALENKLEIEMQAAEYHAANQLLAFQNKSALSRELEECCCDLKQLATMQHCEIKQIDARSKQAILSKVGNTADETQQLIKSSETERIRDELARIRTELLLKRTC